MTFSFCRPASGDAISNQMVPAASGLSTTDGAFALNFPEGVGPASFDRDPCNKTTLIAGRQQPDRWSGTVICLELEVLSLVAIGPVLTAHSSNPRSGSH